MNAMNQQDFVALLRRAGARGGKRTPFCVDDDEIAAYVDGTLESDDHKTLERHLADCNACSGRVGLLFQLLRGAEELEKLPDLALARVRRLGKRASNRATHRWAAAAVIVLAIFTVSNWMPNIEDVAGPDSQATRIIPSTPSPLQVLSPSPGVIVDTNQFTFKWRAVDHSLHYELRIVTESGGLVTEQRVQGTEWPLPDDLALRPGNVYFVRIDAYMPDARTVSSEHIRFKISERN